MASRILLNSFQVWGALFANGVINEYGQLNNGVDLSAIDMTSINYDIFEVVYNDFSYELSPASDFFTYQDEINTILIDNKTPVNTIVNESTFSSLNSDVNREDLINELNLVII